ncbi:hypothetical protein AQUCO_01500438v1 [Aquilegia coerulea]|uniref:Uncharacterized protein n=1 Tax=Aquilegia coerulea TaxID=218851 RepID=A0A2G5DTQ0_AQUCA|nr:hypothetical protein AQUCO_01500438v1 [Aquilegia coerulea]
MPHARKFFMFKVIETFSDQGLISRRRTLFYTKCAFCLGLLIIFSDSYEFTYRWCFDDHKKGESCTQ